MKAGVFAPFAAATLVAAVGGQRHEHEVAETEIPDRLSVDVRSPYFDSCYKRIDVALDGVERSGDVQEYCISEGWIQVRLRGANRKFLLSHDGSYVIKTLCGEISAYWRKPKLPAPRVQEYRDPDAGARSIAAAEAKRQRKAEKLAKEADRMRSAHREKYPEIAAAWADSEPGEHQEVLNAIDACNTGEDE